MTRASEKVAVPRLRFKGCEGAWSSEPFAKFVERRTVAADDDRLPCVEYEDIVSGEGRLNDAFPKKQTHKKGLLFEPDDVLFGKLRPYLRNQLRAEFKGIAVGDFWVFRGTSICGKFLYALTESEGFQFIANISAGSKMPRSDWNLVSSSQFSYPHDSMEQDKIGQGFQTIDTTVSLCESRLSSLRQLKRAMLVKMFPRPGQCVPEIRFKGFERKWEEALLSRYLTVSDSVNVDDTFDANDVLSVSGEYGVVNQILFQGRSFAGASLKNYHVLRHGQVTYTKSPLKQCPYGIVKTNKGADGIVSSLYGVYNAKSGVDAEFVQVYFDNHDRLNAYLRPLVNKGAKNTLLISDENALTGEVCFPSFEEQRKIAAFFHNLDRLIGAAEKKVAKLRQVKASLLERMFV